LYDGKKAFIVEVPDSKDAKNDSEKRADQFASSILIPAQFQNELSALKTENDVCRFAKKLGIAPGIVVGRLQHDKLLPFSRLNKLKVTFTWK
jgi:HTH-type transcriptional regulator/antitoxin HigA